MLYATPACAAFFDFPSLESTIAHLTGLNQHDVAGLALTLGILLFAVVTAVMLVRTRRRAGVLEVAAREQIIALKAEVDRTHALLLAEPQVIVAWAAGDNNPEIFGDTTMITPISAPHRVLAFGTWLEPAQARAMERMVAALRDEGESFATAVVTLSGRPLEAEGRAIGGRAVMRLRDVSGVRREFAELSTRHAKLLGEVDSLRTLIEALPSPIWARDEHGALSFVNHAYARAVEAKNPADAVARGLELLDQPIREELARACAADECYTGRVHAVVAGTRRTFDVRQCADRARQRRHRHRRHRDRHFARRAGPHGRCASPHARPACHRRRDLRRRPEAYLLQHRLSRLVGPRAELPRPGAEQFRRARQIARRPQAAGGAGFPAMEDRAA